MEVTILFEEGILRSQHDLLFRKTWNKYYNQNKRVLFFSILVFVISLLIYVNEGLNSSFVVAFSLGFHYSATFIYGVVNYNKAKKKFRKFTENEIDNFLISENKVIKYEFKENYFSQSNHKFFMKVPWSSIKGYKIIGDNIFIIQDFGQDLYYIISKEEVSVEEYNNIIDFLGIKLTNLNIEE